MTAADPAALDSALAAASASIGTSLAVVSEPLAGGGRSVVVRARRSDNHETVIVKAYDANRAGEAWAREAAALTALRGSRTQAPTLVAAVASPQVVVMEDLGSHDSVATALLAGDPLGAERAVVAWAESLADLHAATWHNVDGFVAALSSNGATGPNPYAMAQVVITGVERLRRAAAPLGIEVGEEVTQEVATIAARLDGEIHVLSPFDPCPDNNVRTPRGLRLIDFEGATVAHPAWDVAYLRVPWPSCWCAWRMPDTVATRAERAWRERLRARLASGYEPDWSAVDEAIHLASLVWCLVTVGWYLPRASAERRAGDGETAPSFRAVIQRRLRLVTESQVAELVASRDVAHRLSAALATEWTAQELHLAPAFRPRAAAPVTRQP